MKVLSVLIHNNDKERLHYIRPAIRKFCLELSSSVKDIKLESIEISYQSEIKPCNVLLSLYRTMIQHKLSTDWNRYIASHFDTSRFAVPVLKAGFLRHLMKRQNRVNWRRQNTIEILLTSKHVRAWERFVESDADFLVVVEDDAIFKPDTVNRFQHRIVPILKSVDRSLYIDLAGGFSLEELNNKSLVTQFDDDAVYFSKPVTNTACGYLINRSMVEYFISRIVNRPLLRFINVDWLVNKLFIRMGNEAENCLCTHFIPTMLCHGSVEGKYLSSIRGM